MQTSERIRRVVKRQSHHESVCDACRGRLGSREQRRERSGDARRLKRRERPTEKEEEKEGNECHPQCERRRNVEILKGMSWLG